MDYLSQNLVVPRGSILFNQFVPGTFAGAGYRQLGNCPEFTLGRDTQTLDHRSSQQGFRTLDARLNIGEDFTGSVITDDVQAANMQLWFGSPSVTKIVVASATAQTETITGVKKGLMYRLGRSLSSPTGLRGVTVISVKDDIPTTFVNNTDYVFDIANGLLTLLIGGSIVNDSDLTITYDVAASTYDQIISGSADVEGELLFISNNPHGPQSQIWLPRATITPNGDLSLMTDPDSPTWQQIPLTITALKLGALPLAYRDSVPVA